MSSQDQEIRLGHVELASSSKSNWIVRTILLAWILSVVGVQPLRSQQSSGREERAASSDRQRDSFKPVRPSSTPGGPEGGLREVLYWDAACAERPTILTGAVTVSIPKSHRRSHFDRPLFGAVDPKLHFTIHKSIRLDLPSFETVLQERLDAAQSRRLLVFVHGFNCDFSDVAYRAAQFAHDSGFNGVVLMFRWPSLGTASVDSYAVDVAQAMAAVPQLASFLLRLNRILPSAHCSLLAHSLGCRLSCSALASIVATAPRTSPIVDELVLAAPDIDKVAFAKVAGPAVRKVAKRVTVYVSARDVALNYSRQLHGNRPRLGESSEGIPRVNGIDIVDASAARCVDITNHSYFASSCQVMDDIRNTIAGMPRHERNVALAVMTNNAHRDAMRLREVARAK